MYIYICIFPENFVDVLYNFTSDYSSTLQASGDGINSKPTSALSQKDVCFLSGYWGKNIATQKALATLSRAVEDATVNCTAFSTGTAVERKYDLILWCRGL